MHTIDISTATLQQRIRKTLNRLLDSSLNCLLPLSCAVLMPSSCRAPNEDFENAPVATLRGFFETTTEVVKPAFQASWVEQFPRVDPPQPGNLWLVFRYVPVGRNKVVSKKELYWQGGAEKRWSDVPFQVWVTSATRKASSTKCSIEFISGLQEESLCKKNHSESVKRNVSLIKRKVEKLESSMSR